MGEPQSFSEIPSATTSERKFSCAIELIILRGVDDIETGDPANYAEAKNDWRESKFAGLRNPCADRRNRQREAEKKMRRGREAFRQRVKENDQRARRDRQQRRSFD